MAFTEMVTKGNGEKAVEVYIKGIELLGVLQRQGIHVSPLTIEREGRFCLTFQHKEIEQYDD
jgi:hypothetical protein